MANYFLVRLCSGSAHLLSRNTSITNSCFFFLPLFVNLFGWFRRKQFGVGRRTEIEWPACQPSSVSFIINVEVRSASLFARPIYPVLSHLSVKLTHFRRKFGPCTMNPNAMAGEGSCGAIISAMLPEREVAAWSPGPRISDFSRRLPMSEGSICLFGHRR